MLTGESQRCAALALGNVCVERFSFVLIPEFGNEGRDRVRFFPISVDSLKPRDFTLGQT